MKVIAINGSAKADGNTAVALDAVCRALGENGVETERIEIGREAMHGCVGCGACGRNRNRRCIFDDDPLNGMLEKMFSADGMVVGSPVYYAGINGALKSFLDRAFYVASANGSLFRHKVGAGVVAVRRGGEVTAWDQLNKYFTISEMFVPSGHYWNMVFGAKPGEALQDCEGLQCLELLGANMAWLLKAAASGKSELPPAQEKKFMNFMR